MITHCKFDKDKDFQEVIPNLAISIQEAIVTGVIKDTVDTTPYTKLEKVSQVGNYIHEPIDIALAADRFGQRFMNAPVAGNNTEDKE